MSEKRGEEREKKRERWAGGIFFDFVSPLLQRSFFCSFEEQKENTFSL